MVCRFRGGYSLLHPFPCSVCAKMLINAGVSQLLVGSDYPDPLSKELYRRQGLRITLIDDKSYNKQ